MASISLVAKSRYWGSVDMGCTLLRPWDMHARNRYLRNRLARVYGCFRRMVSSRVHEAGLLAERAPMRLDATLHADAGTIPRLGQAVIEMGTVYRRIPGLTDGFLNS